MSLEVPASLPRARGQYSSAFGAWVLKVLGWKVVGQIADTPKVIFCCCSTYFELGLYCRYRRDASAKFESKVSW